MTLRDYRCQVCGAEFEHEAERGEAAWEVECPKCGSDDTARLWRAPAVIYRGSGWYTTDNRNTSASKQK